MAGHGHDIVENLLIDAARRIDIGDGHQRRARRQRLDGHAVLNGAHGDGVLRCRAAYAARGPDNVREFDMRTVHVEMARRHRHIDRLDHHAALPVQYAQRMGDFENVAETFEIAVAAAALRVGYVGRAVHRAEIDDIASDMQIARAVAGVQRELRRGERGEMLSDIARHAHHLRLIIDLRAGPAHDIPRGGRTYLKPRLGKQPEGRIDQALHLLT